MPKAVPRSLPENAWAMRAREVANMMAPPTPWTPRARISIAGEVDSPQASDDSENTSQPDGEDTPATEHVARPPRR